MKKFIVLGLLVLGFSAVASAQTVAADQPAPEKKACCKAKASTTADHADCKDKKDGEVKACCKGKSGDEHANCKDSKSGETKACCKDKKEGSKTGATATPASKVARKPSETVKKSDVVTAKTK